MSDQSPNFTRFRATIQYDGTDFHGSQLQSEVRTVQGELESALSRLLDSPTRVDFAGRTDAGVHAVAQEVAFDAPPDRLEADVLRGLAALLPEDVSIHSLREADEPETGERHFHPRFDAERRRYVYVVAPGQRGDAPFLRRLAWRTDRDGGPRLSGIDALDALGQLAVSIPGDRDFGSFARSGQPERGTRCVVENATWTQDPRGFLAFEVVADRFLHHMVRYLVGTMVEIAAERRPADDMAVLLEKGTASRPVFPAPPNGLYLTGVRYSDVWNHGGDLPW